jgi:hypothetical protein
LTVPAGCEIVACAAACGEYVQQQTEKQQSSAHVVPGPHLRRHLRVDPSRPSPVSILAPRPRRAREAHLDAIKRQLICIRGPPYANYRLGILQKARRGARLGVMLVEQGGAADEGGGDSPSSSAFLQLVGVLGRGRCGRAAAATGRGGHTGGTRGRADEIVLLA